MSLVTTLMEDGLSAAFKLIPSYYLIGAAVVVLGCLLVWGKIWFHNKVEAEAQKIVNQYIATKAKDDAELKEVSTGINTKIQIQYLDRVKVITKVVHDNATVITQNVPDKDTILSDGWVSSFNASVLGQPIDVSLAKVATPSGVSAVDALNVDNVNYGVCLTYKTVAQGWQTWYVEQQAAVAKQNKKDK